MHKVVYQPSTGSHSWEWLLGSNVRIQQISRIRWFGKVFWVINTEGKVCLQIMGGHSQLNLTKWLRSLNVFYVHDSSSHPHAQSSLPEHRVVASQYLIIPGTDWAFKSNKKKKNQYEGLSLAVSATHDVWKLLAPSWLQVPVGFIYLLV